MRKVIKKLLKETFENREYAKSPIDFHKLPEDIKHTLFEEYDNYTHQTYDWNSKNEEMGADFNKWLYQHRNNVVWSNIDDIIRRITQDMIILKKRDMADKKIEAFEALIVPSLGDEILLPVLSKFQARVLMNPYLTKDELAKKWKEAKNIIDAQGSIDYDKIEKSDIFPDNIINIPRFEAFVKRNPEYQGVYNDWTKLHDESLELTLTELNAFRNSTTIKMMRDLRNALINIKKKYGN